MGTYNIYYETKLSVKLTSVLGPWSIKKKFTAPTKFFGFLSQFTENFARSFFKNFDCGCKILSEYFFFFWGGGFYEREDIFPN